MRKLLICLASLLLLSSCTWVQLSNAGEMVEIRTATQVSDCDRLGQASSTTMDRLILVDRSSDRLQQELYTLARNEAGAMGGNAIVAATDVTNGRQRFEVYLCP